MHIKNTIVAALLLPVLATGTGACFTGVESTPRIKASDVRKQQAATLTPEQLFLSEIAPLPPAQWPAGRRLLVASDRISLLFTSASDDASALRGHVLDFTGFAPVRSLTGDDAVEASFVADDGRRFFYRIPGFSPERLDTVPELAVPFTVDLDVVERIGQAISGRHYYIRTPAWYDGASGDAVNGLRHVEVIVDSVAPGDENFVAAVYFTVADEALRRRAVPEGATRFVYMSTGKSRAATRNFDTLFAFGNPRKSFPEIKDDVWNLIIASRVREGMSRDECRLALGAPPTVDRVPTYMGMVERWSYPDGVYMVFEDGYLTRFRQ